jgi:hypothetical protein
MIPYLVKIIHTQCLEAHSAAARRDHASVTRVPLRVCPLLAYAACNCSDKCPKCKVAQLIMDTRRHLEVTLLLLDRIQRGVLVSEQQPGDP